MIFKKKIDDNIECVYWFCVQRLPETFLFLRSQKVFMYSAPYFCQILTKLEFSEQIFEKYSNTEFHETSSIGSRVVPYGQTRRN